MKHPSNTTVVDLIAIIVSSTDRILFPSPDPFRMQFESRNSQSVNPLKSYQAFWFLQLSPGRAAGKRRSRFELRCAVDAMKAKTRKGRSNSRAGLVVQAILALSGPIDSRTRKMRINGNSCFVY